MSEPNPYEAPQAHLSPPPSEGVTALDRLMANRLLFARERGYTLGLLLRWNAKGYAVRVLLFGAMLVALFAAEAWDVLALTLGLLLGMFLQDFAWGRAIVRSWDFTVRVTDWKKVRQLAEGEAPEPPQW
jgi:hypothetical protein